MKPRSSDPNDIKNRKNVRDDYRDRGSWTAEYPLKHSISRNIIGI